MPRERLSHQDGAEVEPLTKQLGGGVYQVVRRLQRTERTDISDPREAVRGQGIGIGTPLSRLAQPRLGVVRRVDDADPAFRDATASQVDRHSLRDGDYRRAMQLPDALPCTVEERVGGHVMGVEDYRLARALRPEEGVPVALQTVAMNHVNVLIADQLTYLPVGLPHSQELAGQIPHPARQVEPHGVEGSDRHPRLTQPLGKQTSIGAGGDHPPPVAKHVAADIDHYPPIPTPLPGGTH